MFFQRQPRVRPLSTYMVKKWEKIERERLSLKKYILKKIKWNKMCLPCTDVKKRGGGGQVPLLCFRATCLAVFCFPSACGEE